VSANAAARLEAIITGSRDCFFRHPDTRVVEREGWRQIVTPSARTFGYNEVLYSVLDPADAQRVAAETVAQYRSWNVPFKWVVGLRSSPPELADHLRRLGLQEWPMQGLCAASDLAVASPSEIRVEKLGSERAAEYATLLARGWELDGTDVVAAYREELSRATGHRLFVAYFEGSPAGVASYFANASSAHLMGGVVLPQFRGRGVYRALVAGRLYEAHREGLGLVTTHARRATSGPILEGFGFDSLIDFSIFGEGM
jgi:GNAT superfamily N-acetyltransferase